MALPKPSPLLYVVAVLVALLVAALVYVNHLRKAAREAARNAEAVSLEAKGLLVASAEKQSQLKVDITTLQQQFAGLKETLAAAQAKTPATKIVEVTKYVTLPAIVVVAPLPDDLKGDTCVLKPGDEAQVRVAEIRLSTRLGNQVAVGIGQAWRLSPLPEVLLFSSSFETTASEVHADIQTITAPALPSWGAGPYVGAGAGGVVLGATVVSPVFPIFWGFELEAIGSGGVGFTGNFQGGASVVLRR